jgi:hypothetical protein
MKQLKEKIASKVYPEGTRFACDNYTECEPDNESDSDIELTEKHKQLQAVPLKKPRKQAQYVMTDARKANFEKARQKRMENIQANKKLKEEQERIVKQELETKLLNKANALKKRVAKKKQVLDDIISSESEEEPKQIIVRKKKKPQVIYLEESSEEEKPVVIKHKKTKPIVENIVKEPIKRIIQYM